MNAQTIDIHAHILFPEVMGLCGDAGPELGEKDGRQFFRSGKYVLDYVRFIDGPMSNVEARLALMQKLKVDHQLLSPNPLTYFYQQPAQTALRYCAAANDAMAGLCAKYPERFSGSAQLPLQDSALSVRELHRATAQLKLKAVHAGSDISGRNLSDPALEPVWEALEALQVPLVVHPAPPEVEPTGKPGTTRKWDLDLIAGFGHEETLAVAELVFGGVLDRHPRLHVNVPHGGGTAVFLRGRFESALKRRPWAKNLLKRPFEEQWAQFSFDCLVRAGAHMEFLVKAEGAQRVLLGTNFAGWDQEDEIVQQVRTLPFTEADKAAILAGNARRIFKL
ncbi:MAG TPA: amidohydrolase family protein [Burkholderiales bacterium]|jgi:aminocarboxymuconate-semialdehyde decarboxylase|nr:amidohydrolase family protein [Burkholderiales bacterium]